VNIFVAGATGVLGRRVVPGLIGDGHHVVGLCRSDNNRHALDRFGAEARPGDLFDREAIQRLSADCDAILHLATSIPKAARPSRKHWVQNDRIRTEGTSNLVAAALRNGCRFYLQQSVALLYGDRDGAWVDESTRVTEHLPGILRSAVRMEEIVLDGVSRDRLPAVILRFGSFYSHDSAQTSAMFAGIGKGRFPVIGRGNSFWNMVHVDDAAAAVVGCVSRRQPPGERMMNVCDDEPVTARDLLGFIAGSLGAKRPGSIPPFLAKLAISPDIVKVLRSSARVKNGRAKETLGWKPGYPTYREGFRQAIELWREHRGRQGT